MVAYSFRPRFIDPILAGTKQQTIRPIGLRRHARPGDALQLYTGMRTRQCRLIGRAVCVGVFPISLHYGYHTSIDVPGFAWDGGLTGFAQGDGFAGWPDMVSFWRREHPENDGVFHGLLVTWGELQQEAIAA